LLKQLSNMKKEKPKIKKTTRKKRIGKVISKKTKGLAVVEIERLRKHPYYHKRYKAKRRIAAHDEKDVCKYGDLVEIEECKPISKTKKWKIVEKI
jgi:small subunit ribosomal protein S17